MGARNVKRVYDRWHDLPHLAFRGLAWMALRSMDDHEPPLYYAGRVDLARALGRAVPEEDEDDPYVTKERVAAFKSVRDVLRELARRGAISVHRPPAPDRNTCYALHLASTGDVHRLLNRDGGRSASPVTPQEEWQQGTMNVRHGGRSSFITGDAERPPEEEQEEEGSISLADPRERDEREKSPSDLTTRLTTLHGATADEVSAVLAAATRDGIRSVAAWAASEVGQADFAARLAELRRAARPEPPRAASCGECEGGWLGDADRPAPCPTCKPHATRRAG